MSADVWDCKWNKWRAAFPLDEHLELGSWLFAKRDKTGKVTRVGCKACHLAGLDVEFAVHTREKHSLRPFRKHHTSERHRAAVIALTSCKTCVKELQQLRNMRNAPTLDEFHKVLDERIAGGPCKTVTGICSRKKRQCMEFCIAEGMRAADRMHMMDCVAMASHVDGKKQRFTCRFSATTKGLITRKGILGHITHAGQHCDAVASYVASIDALLKNFCTHLAGAPRCSRVVPRFDKELYEKLKTIHEVFDADAARTMVLTGMDVSNHHGLDDQKTTLFPNNKLAVKDSTHRARRTN